MIDQAGVTATVGLDHRIGQYLRRTRIAKHLAADAVAAIVGLSTDDITAYEDGRRRIPAMTLFDLCAALNISIGDLVFGIDQSGQPLNG